MPSNTAVVLDSTADFPDAAERFPNWRVVPLYVNFGTESYRDGVDLTAAEFYARLQTTARDADDVAADPGRLPQASTRSSAGTSGSSLCTSARRSRARIRARRSPRIERVRTIDTETASVAITMLALAIQRRLDRGTTDEEIDALVERYKRRHGILFTVETLEFLARGGRIGRARAFAGELLNVKPILSIRDGEVIPVKRVRGNRKAFQEFVDAVAERDHGRAGPALRDRARRRAGALGRAREDGGRPAPPVDDRGGDDARRRHRRARGPGYGRLLLVE